jgi:hypothetical protein
LRSASSSALPSQFIGPHEYGRHAAAGPLRLSRGARTKP